MRIFSILSGSPSIKKTTVSRFKNHHEAEMTTWREFRKVLLLRAEALMLTVKAKVHRFYYSIPEDDQR